MTALSSCGPTDESLLPYCCGLASEEGGRQRQTEPPDGGVAASWRSTGISLASVPGGARAPLRVQATTI